MTQRVQSLTVVLDDDYRIDDLNHVMSAISMIKSVDRVVIDDIVTGEDFLARSRVGSHMEAELLKLMSKLRNGEV